MEDALDAPQGLLAPRGDAVKGFVIVFQGPTTLAVGSGQDKQSKGVDHLLFLLCLGIWSLIQKSNM